MIRESRELRYRCNADEGCLKLAWERSDGSREA